MAKNVVGFSIEIDGVDTVLKSFKSIQDEYKKQLKALKEIEDVGSAEYKEQAKLVGALKGKMQQLNKEIGNQAKQFQEVNAATGSYDELSKTLFRLKNEWKKLSKAEREANGELLDNINKIDSELKDLDSSVGVSSRNVGNYKQDFIDAFDEIGGAASGSISIVQNFNNTLKIVSKNPIIFTITALVGVLALLVNAFRGSEKGAEAFKKAGAFLQGVLGIITKLTVDLFDAFVKTFEDNQEGINQFGAIIEKQVINRIFGLVDGVIGLGKVIQSVFKGDLAGAKDAAKDAGDAFKNIFTGGENEDGVKAKIEEVVKAVVKEGAAFSALEAAKIAAEKRNRSLTISLEELTTQEAIFNQEAGDATLSLIEQDAAAEKAREALEKRAKVQIAIAQNNLGLVQQEIALKRAQKKEVSDLLDSEVGLFSELKGAQREYTLAVKDNASARRKIKLDEAERDLDFLLDLSDNQKTINERLIKDENLTVKQREKLLDETKKMFNDSFDEQVKVIENYAGVTIDENDLINESNFKVLNEKVKALGLEDIMAGRLLEIIRDRKTGVQDLAETEVELNDGKIESNEKLLNNEIELSKQLNDIKFQKGLISQEQFNKKSLELDLELLEKSLEFENLKNDEKLRIQNEIELKRLEITKTNLALELEFIDKNYANQKTALNKSLLNGEITEKEHKAKLTELDDKFELAKIAKLYESGELTDEILLELSERELENLKTGNDKILAEEVRKRDKKLALAREISGMVQGITDDLFAFQLNRAEGNEAKQLIIQRRQAKANKVLGVAAATIDTYLSFTAALATYAKSPLVFVIPPLILGMGLANVAKIISTPIPMAGGGFTGRAMGQPDATGQISTGNFNLHGNEYVATSAQVNANPQLFAALESNRKGAALNMNTQPKMRQDNSLTLQAIEAMNNRFDNVTVIADAEKIVEIGLKRLESKKAQTF
jgi:ribosomal protein S17E